jgi:NADH-quinone oxidoreductase subunit L
LPLAAFVLLAIVPISRRGVAVIGPGAVGLSLLAALAVVGEFVFCQPADGAVQQSLWSWLAVAGMDVSIGLRLDSLSATFVMVVTGVGLAIMLYSVKYLAGDDGYRRFFAYMNLFIAAMLILVLADNLVLLFLGWEGVGLCSYLLIGFWYRDPANGLAARKAFLITRIGDAALLVGLLLLFTHLGTLQIQPMLAQAQQAWPGGSSLATAAALLLLAGAIAKSAQLPLQTWLPDAMAGPAPVSALIHAATMVTAGVYLIARTNVLFTLSPIAQQVLAWLGAITLLLAGVSALAQRDIKRILAYSTISQVGYMFLALGAGAWSAGLYHFVTHAMFKSSLFLAAGVLIMNLDDEHDIFKMGGLRKHFPVTFLAVLLSALTLSALPPLTLTFNSKDMILRDVLLSGRGGRWLWGVGVIGAILTACYTFRMIFVVFCGPANKIPTRRPAWWMLAPTLVLSVAGGLAGIAELLSVMFNINGFYAFLERTVPATPIAPTVTGVAGLAGQAWMTQNVLLQAISVIASLLGIVAAWWVYQRQSAVAARLISSRAGIWLRQLWFAGWGFDWFYDRLLVRPYCYLAKVNAFDAIDWCMSLPALLVSVLHNALSRTQTGMVGWYAMGVAAGAILIMALVVWS